MTSPALPENPSRRDLLFDEALALPPGEREPFLNRACADDSALREELVSLVRAHEGADGFFDGLSRQWISPLRSAGVGLAGPGSVHLPPGTRVGRYQLKEVLGEGGMGVVYRARDSELERDVALKLLPSDMVADPEARQALLAEARAVARLDHPHVGVVHEVGETDDAGVYLAMTLHEGETLADRLRRGPLPLPAPEVVRIGRQLASALGAAHAAGLVHWDVKPANFLLTRDAGIRLVDFGIAAALGATSTPRGSPGYASPETGSGSPADARSDLWSLGVLLHELTTGVRPPSHGEGLPALEAMEAKEATGAGGPLPPGLVRAIRSCLEPAPGERPTDASQVMEMLGEVKEEESRNGTVIRGPARGLRHGVLAFAGVAGVALVLALTLAPGWTGEGGFGTGEPGDLVSGEAMEAGAPAWGAANRVLVLPFEDRSGDPELSAVGIMAADWITEGIARAGVANVVDPASTFAAYRESGDPVALAGLFRARLVVAGGYHVDGDSLRFQGRLVDGTDGTVVRVLIPVAAPRHSPLAGLEPLRQATLAAVALHLDPRTTRHELLVTETPPTWEAFLAFVRAKEHFVEGRWSEAREEIVRAEALDSAFHIAVFYGGIAAANLGDFDDLRARRERLGRMIPTPHGPAQLGLDFLDAMLAGDNESSYRTHRRAVDNGILAPNTMGHSHLVLDAVTLGRFREAIAVARESDPTRGELRGWFPYWSSLAMAHHALGEYVEELEIARRARESLGPLRAQPLVLEVRALAALGALEALDAVVSDALRIHPAPAVFLRWTGDYLVMHGHPEEGRRRYVEAVGRGRADLSRAPSPDRRAYLAEALLALAGTGDHEAAREAREVFLELHEEHPLLMDPVAGLGRVAALLGETEEARQWSDHLAGVNPDGRFGGHTLRRARIAVLLGDVDAMVELLQQANREGMRVQFVAREDPLIHAHRAHPAMADFLRPR
ncbi:hypothetical protein BH23GEM11_BH23GEM11_16970 [soil metagenome]